MGLGTLGTQSTFFKGGSLTVPKLTEVGLSGHHVTGTLLAPSPYTRITRVHYCAGMGFLLTCSVLFSFVLNSGCEDKTKVLCKHFTYWRSSLCRPG